MNRKLSLMYELAIPMQWNRCNPHEEFVFWGSQKGFSYENYLQVLENLLSVLIGNS